MSSFILMRRGEITEAQHNATNVSSKIETNRHDKLRQTQEERKTARREKSDERRKTTEHRHEMRHVRKERDERIVAEMVNATIHIKRDEYEPQGSCFVCTKCSSIRQVVFVYEAVFVLTTRFKNMSVHVPVSLFTCMH